MVYLAISPMGLIQALKQAGEADNVWCGCDAISEAEYASMHRPHFSRFLYELADRTMIESALDTIAQHHPGETIWVEAEAIPSTP